MPEETTNLTTRKSVVRLIANRVRQNLWHPNSDHHKTLITRIMAASNIDRKHEKKTDEFAT